MTCSAGIGGKDVIRSQNLHSPRPSEFAGVRKSGYRASPLVPKGLRYRGGWPRKFEGVRPGAPAPLASR
jgi:hypothetical protein